MRANGWESAKEVNQWMSGEWVNESVSEKMGECVWKRSKLVGKQELKWQWMNEKVRMREEVKEWVNECVREC
jgi:hypothetical protein